MISLKIEVVSKVFELRKAAERVIVEYLLLLSLMFAIVGVESTSFAYLRFGTGLSVLFSGNVFARIDFFGAISPCCTRNSYVDVSGGV